MIFRLVLHNLKKLVVFSGQGIYSLGQNPLSFTSTTRYIIKAREWGRVVVVFIFEIFCKTKSIRRMTEKRGQTSTSFTDSPLF
jgi:hypothetical protein